MITLSVKPDIKHAMRYLRRVPAKQIRYASFLALNRAAYDTMRKMRGELGRYLHQPKAWTARGIRYQKAPSKHRLIAYVYIGNDGRWGQEQVLNHHITGGQRPRKGMEEQLDRHSGGAVFSRYFVPHRRIQNARGNITRGKAQQILSSVRGWDQRGFISNAQRGGKYFIGGQGRSAHLRPGVYERGRRGLKPVGVFVASTHYRKRYPFDRLVQVMGRRHFRRHFKTALAQAMRTAR